MNRECRNCAHAELPPYAQSSLKGGLYCREAVRLKMPPIGKVRLPDDVCCNFRPYTEKVESITPQELAAENTKRIKVLEDAAFLTKRTRFITIENRLDVLENEAATLDSAFSRIKTLEDRLSKLEDAVSKIPAAHREALSSFMLATNATADHTKRIKALEDRLDKLEET